MDAEAKIFHLMHILKTFIEEKCKKSLATRRAHYAIIREDKGLSLEVSQQDEILFTQFNDEVTMPEHAVPSFQCELLE